MFPFTQSQIQILVSHEEEISVLELGWCPIRISPLCHTPLLLQAAPWPFKFCLLLRGLQMAVQVLVIPLSRH